MPNYMKLGPAKLNSIKHLSSYQETKFQKVKKLSWVLFFKGFRLQRVVLRAERSNKGVHNIHFLSNSVFTASQRNTGSHMLINTHNHMLLNTHDHLLLNAHGY